MALFHAEFSLMVRLLSLPSRRTRIGSTLWMRLLESRGPSFSQSVRRSGGTRWTRILASGKSES
eukprot:966520-Prorocentrum_minimum.AAC.2